MIQIENVELSKSSVQTNEVFIIKITVSEVLGTWADIKPEDWQTFKGKTWGTAKSNTWLNLYKWQHLINKTWDAIKRKIF